MAAPRKTTVEDEDLDDLDDVLEQFNAPPKPAAQSSSQPSQSSAPPPKAASDDKKADPLEGLDDDFARELTKGMESLFRDIAQGAGLDDVPDLGKGGEDGTDPEKEKVFKAAWEKMLVESMNGTMSAEDLAAMGLGADAGKAKAAAGSSASGSGTGDEFQDNIQKAMDKLKESDRKADEAAATLGPDDFENIFQRITGEFEGAQTDEELDGILQKMMVQLMSKEVLYEPLKELQDKFPGYLKDNATTLSAEDKKRFESQSKLVTQIVAEFEDPSYTEDDPQKGMKVVELMQEMQEYGSPPAEIMGPLPPGFDLGPDGLPKVPDGCTIA